MMTSNGAKTRRITCDWVAWGTLPMFWIFCAFFVVIFYVISYHSTNAAGPRSSEGAALVPTSGPFLYETQDQASFRAQSQNY